MKPYITYKSRRKEKIIFMKSYVGKIVNVDDAEKGEFPNKDGNLIKWSRIVIDIQYSDPNNTMTGKRFGKVMVPDTNTFLALTGNKRYNEFMNGDHTFIVVQEFQNNKPKKYETLVGIK